MRPVIVCDNRAFFFVREVQKKYANTKIALLEARLRKLEVRKQYNSGVQQKIRRQSWCIFCQGQWMDPVLQQAVNDV